MLIQSLTMTTTVTGRFAPSSIRPLDVSPPGRFAPWTFRLWSFRPQDVSSPGQFAPWMFRTLDVSPPRNGRFAPLTVSNKQEAQLLLGDRAMRKHAKDS